MHKSFTRRLVLAVVLGTLSGAIAHADTTPSPASLDAGADDYIVKKAPVSMLLPDPVENVRGRGFRLLPSVRFNA